MTTEKSINEMSVEELEAHLAEKKKADQQVKAATKKEYETNRDSFIMSMIAEAKVHQAITMEFKNNLTREMEEQSEALQKYAGGLSKKSKGGFQLCTKDGNFKITRRLSSQPKWDERADEAVNLMNEFLEDKLKRTKAYNIIKALIQKNKAGDLSYPMIMHFNSVKDDYDDPRWIKAINLLNESFTRVYSGYGYEFHERNQETQEWEKIEMNFHSI